MTDGRLINLLQLIVFNDTEEELIRLSAGPSLKIMVNNQRNKVTGSEKK